MLIGEGTAKRAERNGCIWQSPPFALTVGVLAVIALWTPSQPRSGALPVGSTTPSITLQATTGEFTLVRLRGSKVVLYFYEGAD